MITLKYSEISRFQFAQAVQKISSTPVHGGKASHIHKVVKALGKAREQITKEYASEVIEVFAKRDEAGAIVRPEGDPQGFSPVEEKEKEFLAAQEAFGERTVELKAEPFTPDFISDMKISAQDLDAMASLYTGNLDEVKPALAAVK